MLHVGFRVVAEILPPPPAAPPTFTANEATEHQARWGQFLRIPQQPVNSIGQRLVLIPPGEFLMGTPETEFPGLEQKVAGKGAQDYLQRLPSESPPHLVRVPRPFFLGMYEVTVGQFDQFVSETGYVTVAEKNGKGSGMANKTRRASPEYHWKNPGFEQSSQHPVTNIVGPDAEAFCRWLSKKDGKRYRLPTEAEWEYACRAGSSTSRHFAEKEPVEGWMWFAANADAETQPIGGKRANPFGLHDLYGNVAEICADYFDECYYAVSPTDNPQGPVQGQARVCRGGHFSEGVQIGRAHV